MFIVKTFHISQKEQSSSSFSSEGKSITFWFSKYPVAFDAFNSFIPIVSYFSTPFPVKSIQPRRYAIKTHYRYSLQCFHTHFFLYTPHFLNPIAFCFLFNCSALHNTCSCPAVGLTPVRINSTVNLRAIFSISPPLKS